MRHVVVEPHGWRPHCYGSRSNLADRRRRMTQDRTWTAGQRAWFSSAPWGGIPIAVSQSAGDVGGGHWRTKAPTRSCRTCARAAGCGCAEATAAGRMRPTAAPAGNESGVCAIVPPLRPPVATTTAAAPPPPPHYCQRRCLPPQRPPPPPLLQLPEPPPQPPPPPPLPPLSARAQAPVQEERETPTRPRPAQLQLLHN